MALCDRCLHNSFNMDCLKDRPAYPNASVCNDYVNKANNNVPAIFVPQTKHNQKKEPKLIFSSSDKNKCMFYAYLP